MSALKSMTGFGRGEAPLGHGRVLVEIRALNHRFLEVRVRVPPELADEATFVEQIARERLTRGRFDISVRLEGEALPAPQLSVDRLREAYRALLALRDEIAPGTELPLGSVTALPGLVCSLGTHDIEPVESALRNAFVAAASDLHGMREREGQALCRELAERVRRTRELTASISSATGARASVYRARLRERLERLLGDDAVRLEPGRLELEVAILADKSDVTEELVRLESHFEQLERLFATPEPVGRKLEFLLQEVLREANTLSSKSQDAALSHLVVELKAEIERMREQVQNVE